MSLLSVVQTVSARIGLPQPTSVIGNTDLLVSQLLALANEEGEMLSARHGWQILTNEATFTTVATEIQGSITTIAGSDFRYVVNETIWNRSLRRPVFGPLMNQQWQQLKAQQINGPWNQYRIVGNSLKFIPIPSAGQSCYFEWMSKNWCQSSGGTGQSVWTADTDTFRMDEDLFKLGLLWRFKQAKGFEYAEDFNKYEQRVEDAISRDGSKPIINLGQNKLDVYPGVLVPSGGWMQ